MIYSYWDLWYISIKNKADIEKIENLFSLAKTTNNYCFKH